MLSELGIFESTKTYKKKCVIVTYELSLNWLTFLLGYWSADFNDMAQINASYKECAGLRFYSVYKPLGPWSSSRKKKNPHEILTSMEKDLKVLPDVDVDIQQPSYEI